MARIPGNVAPVVRADVVGDRIAVRQIPPFAAGMSTGVSPWCMARSGGLGWGHFSEAARPGQYVD
jgi:hypothetical protein